MTLAMIIKNDEQKNQLLVDYRSGDIYVPKVKTHEALLGMANDFVGSIMNNRAPRSSYKIGLDVIKILEASNKSIKAKGCEILIN